MIRQGIASDLIWIKRILQESPEAAQWLPETEAFLVCEPDGFLAYRQVALDEYEILNLAVAVAARRQGVARQLIHSVLSKGGRWFLEVRESNISARNTYQNAGFQETGMRRNYYYNPMENAIVLVWQP